MTHRIIVISSFIAVATGSSYVYFILTQAKRPYRTTKQTTKSWGYVCALCCFVLASRQIPRPGSGTQQSGNHIDVMVMLDVSQSMTVQDMSDNTSRLATAKQLLTTLIQAAPQARRGLGIFAGEAQGVLPITTDTDLFATILAGVDHRNLVEQGTNIPAAIRLAKERFQISGTGGNGLLILSDGGEETFTLDTTLTKELKNLGSTVIVVGLGTQTGGPIIEGTDIFGNPVTKQRQGSPVISTLHEQPLKQLAQATDGTYLRYDTKTGDRLKKHLLRMPPKEQATGNTAHRSTQTPFWMLLGTLALLSAIFHTQTTRLLLRVKTKTHTKSLVR